MKFSYMSSSAKWTFGLLALAIVLLTAAMLVAARQAGPVGVMRLPRTPGQWLGFAASMGFVLALVASIALTRHEVGGRALILRQGLLIRCVIPLANIDSVRETARMPFGLGVRVGPDRTIFINTAVTNLVAIELKELMRFRLLFLVPLWKMRHVVVNVTDPAAFVQSIRERLADKGR
jgi:hypothetical protein